MTFDDFQIGFSGIFRFFYSWLRLEWENRKGRGVVFIWQKEVCVLYLPKLCSTYGQVFFFPKLLSGTFVFCILQKRKCWKRFGNPPSLKLRRTRKGERLFLRLSQLVTAASYNGADVSAFPQKGFSPRPNSLNLFYRPLSGTAPLKKNCRRT